MKKQKLFPIIVLFFGSFALVACDETTTGSQPGGGNAPDGGSALDGGLLSDAAWFPADSKVVQVAAGPTSTCAVRKDGSVWCWGALSREPRPVIIGNAGAAVNVAVGWAHACVLKADHSLWCWGRNHRGQLGDGTNSDRSAPVEITALGHDVASIAARNSNTCAIKTDGSLWCWGDNELGQVGDGSFEARNSPTQISPHGNQVKQVSIGYEKACAVTVEGALWCWEFSYDNRDPIPKQVTELGDAVASVSSGSQACAVKVDGSVWCGVNSFEPFTNFGAAVKSISVSDNYACAIKMDDSLGCWGVNNFGQLSGPNEGVDSSVEVTGLNSDVIAVSTGDHHTCAVTADGTLRCWGGNDWGQLGNGDTGVKPRALNLRANAISSTCAIKADSSLWCWGLNDEGQLGDGTTTTRRSPVQVTELGTAASAIVGSSCAVKADQSLWCWGSNAFGQVGDGTTAKRTSPVWVSALSNTIKPISSDTTCAIDMNDSLWCWGNNANGQLGDGTTTHRATPVRLSALGGVASVSGNYGPRCAIKSDRSLWCWGASGSLAQVSILGNSVIAVSSGSSHTCAIKDDGSAWCWGNNAKGQLGNGNTNDQISPVRISTLGDTVVAISSAYNTTCAIERDGSLWCWGENDYGQVGDGTNVDRATPNPVSNFASVESIALGFRHACALLKDKSVWCWGDESYGYLGRGDVLRVRNPSVVSFSTP